MICIFSGILLRHSRRRRAERRCVQFAATADDGDDDTLHHRLYAAAAAGADGPGHGLAAAATAAAGRTDPAAPGSRLCVAARALALHRRPRQRLGLGPGRLCPTPARRNRVAARAMASRAQWLGLGRGPLALTPEGSAIQPSPPERALVKLLGGSSLVGLLRLRGRSQTRDRVSAPSGARPQQPRSALQMKSPTERMIAEIDGPIGWLVFNNPARRNAVSMDMWQAIPEILDAYERDPAVARHRPQGRGRQGVRVGRRHLGIRAGAVLARGDRALRGDRHRGAARDRERRQADDRDDPRLLFGRRRRRRACVRTAHRLGECALRHPGGAPRHLLSPARHHPPHRAGGAGLRQGDLLYRAPLHRGGGL